MTKKLKAAREALEHIHQTMGLEFGFELWDGSQVPTPSAKSEQNLRIHIADPGVVSALLRRPKFDTVIDLWVTKRVDLLGGTFFDFAEKRPKGKTSKLAKQLSKLKLGKAALPFLFSSSGPKSARMMKNEGARDGSEASNKKNIQHHYDVSNDFYALFLDELMLYTCGYFTDWDNSLEQAQIDKLDMICRKLRLKPGDRMLDIGCGWGALICHAAEHYGVEAHGVTLSEEQFSKGLRRIAERGLSERATIELKDFSKLTGKYTKISSIGMFEHVGIQNHRRYFATVNRLLEPRGLYLHHAITRPGKATDKKFNKKPAEYQALIKNIFPGGELDHIGMSLRNLESSGFEVHDVEAWREHYALTTDHWAHRLMANEKAAIEIAGEETYRMWVVYLCGVSLAFKRGSAQIFQTVASKKTKGPSGLAPTRAELYSD
ncbi:MAG: cyclopropane-fatty-acyl-phospholipid synthase family protein [Hyphomicrobiales bacterium]